MRASRYKLHTFEINFILFYAGYTLFDALHGITRFPVQFLKSKRKTKLLKILAKRMALLKTNLLNAQLNFFHCLPVFNYRLSISGQCILPPFHNVIPSPWLQWQQLCKLSTKHHLSCRYLCIPGPCNLVHEQCWPKLVFIQSAIMFGVVLIMRLATFTPSSALCLL